MTHLQVAEERMYVAHKAWRANVKLSKRSPRKTSSWGHTNPLNLEWAAAYTAWMQARAAAGDRFALRCGYTKSGWSIEGYQPGCP